ncbi:MAG TPA: hypothetical protein VF311_12145 [Terriglobales bacterium]
MKMLSIHTVVLAHLAGGGEHSREDPQVAGVLKRIGQALVEERLDETQGEGCGNDGSSLERKDLKTAQASRSSI